MVQKRLHIIICILLLGQTIEANFATAVRSKIRSHALKALVKSVWNDREYRSMRIRAGIISAGIGSSIWWLMQHRKSVLQTHNNNNQSPNNEQLQQSASTGTSSEVIVIQSIQHAKELFADLCKRAAICKIDYAFAENYQPSDDINHYREIFKQGAQINSEGNRQAIAAIETRLSDLYQTFKEYEQREKLPTVNREELGYIQAKGATDELKQCFNNACAIETRLQQKQRKGSAVLDQQLAKQHRKKQNKQSKKPQRTEAQQVGKQIQNIKKLGKSCIVAITSFIKDWKAAHVGRTMNAQEKIAELGTVNAQAAEFRASYFAYRTQNEQMQQSLGKNLVLDTRLQAQYQEELINDYKAINTSYREAEIQLQSDIINPLTDSSNHQASGYSLEMCELNLLEKQAETAEKIDDSGRRKVRLESIKSELRTFMINTKSERVAESVNQFTKSNPTALLLPLIEQIKQEKP